MVGLTLADEDRWPEVKERVRDCFGVAKFYRAHDLPRDLDSLKRLLPGLLEGRSFESFRITTNRSDKRFSMNSEAVNRDIGAFVKDMTGARVDLTNPDLCVFLDIHSHGILVYFEEVSGYGGLPVGVSGPVAVMLSGGIDSPVAAWSMMKRGCRAHFVHFHSYPLVDRTSMEKATDLVQHLTRHQDGARVVLCAVGRNPEANHRVGAAVLPGGAVTGGSWCGSPRNWPGGTRPGQSSPVKVAARSAPKRWTTSRSWTLWRKCPYFVLSSA